MLEVLFIGLVGLTYTCVQTLFFLNCLNSRRREQRRLEKIYRSSLRKLSVNGRGAENGINGNGGNAVNCKSAIENGGHTAENGEVRVGGKEGAVEEESEGRLVTRLVVRNGKEAAAASQEARGISHCVRVQNAIVQLNEQSVEGEGDVAGARNDTQSHRSREASPNLKEKGCHSPAMDTSGPQSTCSYNITVNSNMIEIRDDGGRPDLQREANFEPSEEPTSMTTQVTVCEDLDCSHEALVTGQGASCGSPTSSRRADGSPESLISHDFQEVQEKRLDIEDGCSTEDELEDVCRKPCRGDGGRSPANLISTISQILNSPPDSMEPGTESLPLDSNDGDGVFGQSAFPVGHADESGGVSEMDKKGKQRGENKGQPSSASHRVSSRPNPPRLRAGDREGGGTWTLPRAERRQLDSHGSLPRTRARASVTAGKEGKGSLEGHTPQQIADGRPTRRDALPGRAKAGIGQSRSTCHSSPAMAGAATIHAHAARLSTALHTGRDEDTDVAESCTRTDANAAVSEFKDDSNCTTEKATGRIPAHDCEPVLIPIPADSEKGSADSLSFRASDKTGNENCDQGRESDGKGEDDSIYESIEPQNTRQNDENSEETGDSDETDGARKSPRVPSGNDVSQGPSQTTQKVLHYTQDDEESVGSGSHYETLSEPDTHRDSGYESPVKADVHSGDDSASVSSGDHDHHYEDIDPALMASRAAARESAGRARDAASAASPSRRSSSSRSNPREGSSKEEHEEEGNGEAARRKQRLQGLDDLIAEFDDGGSGTAATAARASSGRRQLQSTLSMPPAAPHPPAPSKERAPVSRTHSEPPPPPPMPSTPSPKASPSASHKTTRTFGRRDSPSHSSASSPSQSPPSSKPSSPRAAHDALRASAHDGEGPSEEGVVRPSEFIRRNSQRSENGSFRGGHRKLDRPTSLPLDVAEHYGRILSAGRDREAPSGTQEDPGLSTQPNKSPVMNGKSLPFIPPRFPSQPSGSGLIKPSEYLRSLGDTGGNGNGIYGTNGHSNTMPHSNSNSISHSSSASLSSGSVRSQHSFVETSAALQQTEATMSSSSSSSSPASSPSSSSTSSSHDTIDNHSSATVSPPVSMPPGPLPAIPEATEEEAPRPVSVAPPPPPAPPAPPANTMPLRSNSNAGSNNNSSSNGSNSKTMLPTISVTDLQSVQLRKTETKVSRANNVPLKTPMSPEPAFTSAKDNVIAELKMGVDISGIKKMKSERAREEERHGVMEKEELKRQFSAVNFVDQVPDVDNAGNRIPEWKRQMLARKAAERAKKEAEEQRVQEAEEKRLQSIPLWKRQLLMRREDESKRGNLYTPKVEDVKKIRVPTSPLDLSRLTKKEMEDTQSQYSPRSSSGDSVDSPRSNGESADASNTITLVTPAVVTKIISPCHVEDDDEPQIPWRTNLRKTNSKLSLLD